MPSTQANKIALEGVSKEYLVRGERRVVLKDLSLVAHANETVGIIGTTGVGKSTALRLVAGFEDATSGTVTVWNDGRPAAPTPTPKTGYLFQQPALFPWLTIYDNVIFGAKHARTYLGHRALAEHAEEILERVGLADARRLYPYEVSGGMRARTALARVFLTKPEILLMDEPFGALDALTRREMYALLRELIANSAELTTLLITHDVDEAISLCGSILVMTGRPGRVSAVFTSDLSGRHESIDKLQSEPEYMGLKNALLASLTGAASNLQTGAQTTNL